LVCIFSKPLLLGSATSCLARCPEERRCLEPGLDLFDWKGIEGFFGRVNIGLHF